MAEIYCDFINGNDTTGDGSAGNPWKTITKASIGLSGGDEVRVAKSPAPSALTGTLGFTAGSTAVTGSGTDFTGELVIGDFVKGGDGEYYEIITITDNTNAILYKKYPSATGAGVSSFKLGVTSTGAAAAAGTQVQVVSASGSSIANRLKISGGWDLTGPTQDGQTYFRQMHATFATRNGYGLYGLSKNYVEVERIHLLRYNYGVYFYAADNNLFTSMNCLSNKLYGVYLYDAQNNTFVTPVFNSNNSYGIGIGIYSNTIITSPICNSNGHSGIRLSTKCVNTIITSPTCNYNNSYGIYIDGGYSNVINSPTCNNNAYGIFFGHSMGNIVTDPTCNDNTSYGLRSTNSLNSVVNEYSGSGNGSGDVLITIVQAKHFSEHPAFKCQHFNAAGVNKCFYEYGITERNTGDARSTQCLKFDPSSATYYILQSFFFIADSGVEQTLSAYVKDDAAFNGDIQAAIFFMGKIITAWAEWTPTTSYAQKTIVAASGDIPEDGVLELRIKVRGAAGNVFVDDLATA